VRRLLLLLLLLLPGGLLDDDDDDDDDKVVAKDAIWMTRLKDSFLTVWILRPADSVADARKSHCIQHTLLNLFRLTRSAALMQVSISSHE
jgi:hypothetical protein